MKYVWALIVAGAVLGLATQVFSQGPTVGDEILREVRDQRHDDENEAARQRALEQSEHVKETMERPPLPEQQPLGVGLQQRLTLVQDKLLQLQNQKRMALEAGMASDKIEAITIEIKKLQEEARALKSQLGLAPE